jgi:hypothetical protein
VCVCVCVCVCMCARGVGRVGGELVFDIGELLRLRLVCRMIIPLRK